MTAIRRYIQAPLWDGDDFIANNVKFMKDLEQLLLDAGLVKSNVADNLDMDTFDMSEWFESNKDRISYNYIPLLVFNMNDSIQNELPISIKFAFGFYRGGTHPYHPYHPYMHVSIYASDNTQSAYTSPHTSNAPAGSSSSTVRTPTVTDDEYDSFVTNIDGFLSVNICNGFGTDSGQYSADGRTKPPMSFCSFQVERSFDELGNYTAENVNVFLPYGSGVGAKNMRNVVLTPDERFTETQTTYVYFNKYNKPFSKGKVVFHSMYHVFNDSTVKPSPNMLAIADAVLHPTQEIKLSINSQPESNFIALTNGNDGAYSHSRVEDASGHNQYVTKDARVIVRFE